MRAIYSRAVTVVAFTLVATSSAYAQPFANLKNSLVDYSVAAAEPRLACDALAASFRDKDVVSLTARSVAAVSGAPAHCRISGILAPEIGFEVNLPARWN